MKTEENSLQLKLDFPGISEFYDTESYNGNNKILPYDSAFHNWYRFVLSFPPHLVRDYIEDFGLSDDHVILDPFCGTGTTLVEAKLHNIPAIGVDKENNIWQKYQNARNRAVCMRAVRAAQTALRIPTFNTPQVPAN